MIQITEFIQQTPELVSLLKRLVEIESPTTNKAAVDRVGRFIESELRELGAQVTIDQQLTVGDHVIGRFNHDAGPKSILILCHMDTVHPVGSLVINPSVERDGKLFGPGAMDMKAGIAMLLVAIKALQDTPDWPAFPITALFTSDEETGSLTSRLLIEHLARDASLVLCLEPCLPDGALKTWRKGVGDFEVVVRGRAAHAGAAHDQGRNAIEELAHQVIAIQGLTDYKKGTTLNVGVIQGGTVSNVVPSEARAEVDMRVMVPEEAERIIQQLQSLKPALNGTTVEVRGGLNRPPMPRSEIIVKTFSQAKQIAEELGIELREGGTGGGSDANFVAPLGVPVLDGLGAQGEGQHSEREYVLINSLPERTGLLAALLSGWKCEM